MSELLRNLKAHIYFGAGQFLPPVAMRLDRQMATHAPIMGPAFLEDVYAQYLTFRILTCLDEGRQSKATAYLNRLEPRLKDDADRALYHFLHAGMLMLGPDDLADCLTDLVKADEYGHRYHLAHIMLGKAWFPQPDGAVKALTAFDKAIDDVYGYPPLDDLKRSVIAQVHAMRCGAFALLDRLEDAESALRLAEAARDSDDYLSAASLLDKARQAEAQRSSS